MKLDHDRKPGTIKKVIEHQCEECGGSGWKHWKHRESGNHSSGSVTTCPTCNGTGKRVEFVRFE